MVDLSILSPEINENLALFEILNGKYIPLDHQLESGNQAFMWFVINDKFEPGSKKTFVLIKDTLEEQNLQIRVQKTQDELKLTDNKRNILNYRLSEKLPPEGIDTIYRRSAYIHPLWSPGGEILSRIQPPDHFHHYGIWNPYTLTHINDREIDYWNLAKGLGTVRFAGLLSTIEGNLFGGFSVHKEHIDFGASEFKRVNINETLEVRYWSCSKRENRYIIDYSTRLSNAIKDTIIFDAYRYGGGIGFRATQKWRRETCTVLTSEGKDRLEADGSRARWCIIEGISSVDEGRSGILFMSHPFNREHPEPMRVWPLKSNEGQMFFEFCPIRHKEWKILQGKVYSLKYRMIVFDGEISAEKAEMYWNSFARPPVVELHNRN
ncbi:MAG: PmoA family protein [Bacteroidales bacterium]|nr:PmoA family protein [Bacteroidales bacterium]